MTYTDTTSSLTAHPGWLRRAEAWLDSKGKGAWIAAMVLGFIFFWPVGLALLFYMIWSKRMFGCSKRKHANHFKSGFSAMRPSGNSAFDSYKAETLRRLEDEQQQFEEFLKRLRDARDKAEFDQFMEDRATKAKTVETEDA
ncbi:MAG: DUF2852 domain-containing protein [Pseudomonadota bacterium]|uniref:DUF2852 domain-containing protein n=1 Tax=Thalassococcus sp. TaxID=1928858 RepID=UPI001B249229|nr:DUF2852 domain-containing protein [Thalassococcus sp.]MBO6866877.1 DUF2852 domain-containing protein [Thalassococcus sp.]MEC7670068.1 DUF2852 domain-containing protein [Pseudomonadota bacterium]MEC8579967.1 DUF2852 domain-containing protein [Pseudomonadota bacterium]MEE3360830.1 DUF2852 domain-containing protein [Pseudomonadota bacterium]